MKKSVCIIDDDEIYQKIASRMIDRAAVFSEAIYFTHASDALEFLEDESKLPDVILLDINMPLMDGWQFLDEIERNNPCVLDNSRVYIVSSSIAGSDREKAKLYPKLKGFISKPISVSILQELVEA